MTYYVASTDARVQTLLRELFTFRELMIEEGAGGRDNAARCDENDDVTRRTVNGGGDN